MNNIPQTQSVANLGSIRVTACTARIWRLEWARDGQHADEATLTVGERKAPTGAFSISKDGETWILKNSELELRLIDDGQPFHAGNCQAIFRLGSGQGTWEPGRPATGNLGGARRTLDSFHANMKYNKEKNEFEVIPEEPGLLSTDGWAVHDDSSQPLLRPMADGRLWPVPRPLGERRDWYLCCFGLDWKGGLSEATMVFGVQPPPPRWALGLWVSRWWAYTDQDVKALMQEYRQHACPVDVLVLDMEWHTQGWGGCTWEKAFFPDHQRFLKEIKEQYACKITLNLHPHEGVAKDEPAFAAMAAANNLPADAVKLEFDCTKPAMLDTWFQHGLHPHEKVGIDFWWLDWQQGTTSAIEGLDPLPWLNHRHWQDQVERIEERNYARPMAFTRFGGLGSGRMPIGFSGDTESSWRTLKYLVQFTAASAHSLYGYWSHDVGGFFESPWEPKLSKELYLRWVQLACHHPIVRTHAGRIADADRRFWLWGEPYGSLMVVALARRRELAAYLDTANHQSAHSGVATVHGLWIDYPQRSEARDLTRYALGNDFIIAPVLSAVSEDDDRAEVSGWLPLGLWYDMAQGDLVQGDAVITRRYDLRQVPIFARAGACIPVYPQAGSLGDPQLLKRLGWEIIPGADGVGVYLEDDGSSANWSTFATANAKVRQDESATILHLAAWTGTHEKMLERRDLDLRFLGGVAVQSVKVDGRELSLATDGEGWSFDSDRLAVVVRLKDISIRKDTTVTVRWQQKPASVALGRTTALSRQAFHALRSAFHETMRPCASIFQTAHRIALNPHSALEELKALPGAIDQTREQLTKALGDLKNEHEVKFHKIPLEKSLTWITAINPGSPIS